MSNDKNETKLQDAYREFYEFIMDIDGPTVLTDVLWENDELVAGVELEVLIAQIRHLRGEPFDQTWASLVDSQESE